MDVSADDFAALFAAVSTWGRWGEADERGALHRGEVDPLVECGRLGGSIPRPRHPHAVLAALLEGEGDAAD